MGTRSATYEQYIKSAKWRTISAAMKKLANYTCKRCGKKFHSSQLDAHHRNYDRLGSEHPSDLEVLCKPCHAIADSQRTITTQIRREDRRHERQHDAAIDTFLTKKYGSAGGYDQGMYDEAERWLARKRYGETGEWDLD
jgi:5-methylcytosine-specific restriction endonuclease McrA